MPNEIVDLDSPVSFADALAAAFDASALSLDRISHHLSRLGVTCSASTLSLWRHGRSRPAKAESLRAVIALESVLNVPAGSLTSALSAAPRVGSCAWWRQPVNPGDVTSLPRMTDIRTDFGLPADDGLRRLSLHLTVHIEDGRETHRTWTHVVAADRPGIERVLVAATTHRQDGQPAAWPAIRAISGARVGRHRKFPDEGLAVAELIFDQVLQGGQLWLYDVEVTPPPGPLPAPSGWDTVDMVTVRPARRMTLDVRFTGRIPAHVETAAERAPLGRDIEASAFKTKIPMDGNVQVTLADVLGGRVAVRWRNERDAS